MKRRSAFVTIGIVLAAIYILYTAAVTGLRVHQLYAEMQRTQTITATTYLKLGRLLLEKNEAVDLDDRMSAALSEKQVHFYRIRSAGHDMAYGNLAGGNDLLQLPTDGPEGTYETDNYRYFLITEGKYELILGYKTSFAAFAEVIWNKEWLNLLGDLVLVVLCVVGLALYSFRDLRFVIKMLGRKGQRRGDVSLAKSKETLTLVRGISGYETKIDELNEDRAMFRTQVLPALRKELESKKKPPYEFGCTLVRTDINNFTNIFSSDKREHFMLAIDEFFIGVTHIVSRYNGYVYEFIGDEVLFYFKDEEHQNSAAIAIAAIRDVNQLALELSGRTEAQADYNFRVKSSIAWGLIRFGPLVDAFALAGAPLIETVRVLNYVTDKVDNSVLFDVSLYARIKFLCSAKAHQVVTLKGLPGERHLYVCDGYLPLTNHLSVDHPKDIANTLYYRSDKDIVTTLDFVRTSLRHVPISFLTRVVGQFKQYKVTTESEQVRDAYLALAEALLHWEGDADRDEVDYLLASLVSASPSLFPPQSWKTGLREAILKCLKHPNRRVVANALDVFSEIEPNANETIFIDLLKQSDNRIAANSLIKEGKRSWDKSTAKKITAMLDRPSDFFKASALFALGEIASHIKQVDPVAYEADVHLRKLMTDLPKYTVHSNQMVRRQAMGALQKSGELHAKRSAIKMLAFSADAAIKEEVLNALVDQKQNRAA